jgi:hypothetical protein
LVFTFVFFSKLAQSVAVPVDPATNCPTQQKPAQLLAILLDVSEGFSEPQLVQVRNHLEHVLRELPRHAQVEVFVLDHTGSRLNEPLIRACNPGSGADFNRIYENPELARRHWEQFLAKLQGAIAKELATSGRTQSPLFETIQSIGVTTFGRYELDAIPRRILIVSDMLQHVPGRLSMYGRTPSFEDFKTSPYFMQVRSNLQNTDVAVLYIYRTGVANQGTSHIAFWEQYFAAQGAALVAVDAIYGDR